MYVSLFAFVMIHFWDVEVSAFNEYFWFNIHKSIKLIEFSDKTEKKKKHFHFLTRLHIKKQRIFTFIFVIPKLGPPNTKVCTQTCNQKMSLMTISKQTS